MYQSLLSRFQGGLLGTLLGEKFVSCPSVRFPLGSLKGEEEPDSDWCEIAKAVQESLMERGRWNQQDCLNRLYSQRESLLDCKQKGNSAQVAVATLPILLFYHETPARLREEISQVASLWLNPDESLEDILVWGQAIALILRGKFDGHRIIPQILDSFPGIETPLIQKLHQVQDSLGRREGLKQVLRCLSSEGKSSTVAIALSLYCFACTPEDFSLCLTRTLQTQDFSSLTAALTGAIAGVYNGVQGIPLNWRLTCPQTSELCQRGETLFAVWSGIYDPRNSSRLQDIAIASPRLIQPRSTPPVISQQ